MAIRLAVAEAPCYDADFYPFGGERIIADTCPQNYKFEGKERDAETGNDDFGARYYSNRFGRWLSADWSAVPAPVPYANLTNPQTLNLYAMVSDNPETFADLDGHDPNDAYIFLAGAEAAAPEATPVIVGVALGVAIYQNRDAISQAVQSVGSAVSNVFHSSDSSKSGSSSQTPTKPYDTGEAKDLKGNSQVGDGLDVHHVPQSQPASQTIEGYDKETAPAIAVPEGEHRKIPTEKGEATRSPRDQLAKDAKDLRNNTNAPNSQVQKVIDLNKAKYPEMRKP